MRAFVDDNIIDAPDNKLPLFTAKLDTEYEKLLLANKADKQHTLTANTQTASPAQPYHFHTDGIVVLGTGIGTGAFVKATIASRFQTRIVPLLAAISLFGTDYLPQAMRLLLGSAVMSLSYENRHNPPALSADTGVAFDDAILSCLGDLSGTPRENFVISLGQDSTPTPLRRRVQLGRRFGQLGMPRTETSAMNASYYSCWAAVGKDVATELKNDDRGVAGLGCFLDETTTASPTKDTATSRTTSTRPTASAPTSRLRP